MASLGLRRVVGEGGDGGTRPGDDVRTGLGGIVGDPLAYLCDGRRFFRPRGRGVDKGVVPSWWKDGTICSVALTRSEKVRASRARDLAQS